jgi:iron complex transport system substrate-binding protein
MGVLLCFASCTNSGSNAPQTNSLQYASGFSVIRGKNFTLICVLDPWKNAHQKFEFLLTDDAKMQLKGHEQAVHLPSKLKRIIALSTTHVAMLSALGESDKLCAVSNPEFIFDQKVQAGIASRKIQSAGSDANLDYEKIAALKPDLVLAYGVDKSFLASYNKLQSMHIAVMPIGEYMEDSPLGQAEWIKCFGALTHKESLADSIFNQVCKEYNATLQLVPKKSFPKTICNAPWKGVWYVPGGLGFTSTFIKQAGGAYPWSELKEKGSLSLSFEDVYAKSYDAEFWINPGAAQSVHELIQIDARLATFPCVKKGNLYTNDARKTAAGGNDFWESGIVYPQRILKDLVAILHPDALPAYHFYYYRKLPGE